MSDLPLQLPPFEPGWVWLAGAGPGDPGLLTLLALHALRHADVVVYDALVDGRILDLAAPAAVREFAGKRGGKPSPKQPDISRRLVQLAREGRSASCRASALASAASPMPESPSPIARSTRRSPSSPATMRRASSLMR